MIKPNYAVKALIQIPAQVNDTITEAGVLKKADSFISDCYRARRRTYNFLLLCFCLFSVLGIYYYSGYANGQTPISLYIPVKSADEITVWSLFLFRKLHIFVSLFIFLTGFTVFGLPTSLLFIASDAFVIGFSIRYSLNFLLESKSLGFVLLYFFCISLYAVIDVLLCCEVIKYSRYARSGTKEMLNIGRFAGYIFTYLFILLFNMLSTYLFNMI
ncbi:MAG: hypothetical protein A2Y15_08325 [Clostridiales bacterium GWF2_36_10]|nr:MAG: hypothetical protein A2Y15_08325 [Clostridiales bacterium GWF2_36_10]HAN21054.1 hypothetical protein [Clostridiales bacterium]